MRMLFVLMISATAAIAADVRAGAAAASWSKFTGTLVDFGPVFGLCPARDSSDRTIYSPSDESRVQPVAVAMWISNAAVHILDDQRDLATRGGNRHVDPPCAIAVE